MNIITLLNCCSILGLATLILKLISYEKNSKRLSDFGQKNSTILKSSLTIIIPTYNEESNIENCLRSVVRNSQPCSYWEIIVADDCSSDQTVAIVESLNKEIKQKANKIKIVNAGERPKREKWVGKNWPCARAAEETKSEWILFIDADTSLRQETLLNSIAYANKKNIDLLSLAPKIECECFAEWIVQPIISTLLCLGFPIKEINNDSCRVSFAAGPFMLFKRASYQKVGGHKRLAGEVIEDLAFARLIKHSGMRLRFLLGLDFVSVRMYSNLEELWEGWSKNWFLGLDRNISKSILASIIVLLIFSFPTILLLIACCYNFFYNSGGNFVFISIIYCFLSLAFQLFLRVWTFKKFKMGTKYWWLMWLGGILVFLIGLDSIYKTLTGRNWTWKGRLLAR